MHSGKYRQNVQCKIPKDCVFNLTNILRKIEIIFVVISESHLKIVNTILIFLSFCVEFKPQKKQLEPSYLETDKQLNAFLHSF